MRAMMQEPNILTEERRHENRIVRSGVSVEEYMEFENTTEERHEFHNGDIITMPGASPFHENLIVRLFLALGKHLAEPDYTMYSSGLKVAVPTYKRVLYPDISIVRGEPNFINEKGYQLINPTVIIEILSPSTAAYDLSDKFEYYRSLASLEEIAFFEQQSPSVRLFRLNAHGRWEIIEIENGVVEFTSVQATISLAEIYLNV
ncbi:MAG: Uma2 family endonuclease [Candidatus Kapaibacterium sp.]|nr:MAG: Uma2 family endonuclease [Candidatus Kapabacteria bacterium]